ncbi:unnamed protein product [Durusdinium trenchii]|uniref:Uncharacterized protein n=1 Tax=Durusdinium trenchii TaxID=1381693 RepID=A0ABP0PZU8_9DINO
MQMDANALGHCAPDCSSWGIPSRGTSLRNFINVAGNMFLPWIQGANMQVSRLVLVLLLMMSRNLCWVLEQPRNSLLFRHRRFSWFTNHVAYVFQCAFWMMKHGSPTPKPSVCYSNMREIQRLHLGALRKAERERRTRGSTTRH